VPVVIPPLPNSFDFGFHKSPWPETLLTTLL
jgi:hypothetical protein